MSYKATILGINKLFKKLDATKRASVVEKSLNQAALNIKGWSVRNRLSGPRPLYLGVKTGRLRSSLAVTKTVKEGNKYVARIGTNVEYATKHEFGTGRSRARPFLRPAIEDRGNQDMTLAILVKNINKAILEA